MFNKIPSAIGRREGEAHSVLFQDECIMCAPTLQCGFKASHSDPPEDSFSKTYRSSQEALIILYL